MVEVCAAVAAVRDGLPIVAVVWRALCNSLMLCSSPDVLLCDAKLEKLNARLCC
jgi:hypothetical protein